MPDLNENAAEPQTTTAPPPSELTTILGGVEIQIEYQAVDAFDEATLKRLEKFQPLFGTKETVKVRQILVSNMPRYGNAILSNDEAGAIELYCGREPGWADALTRESANAIADKGLEINLDFFSAWYQRQAKWKKTQTPHPVTELMNRLTELERMIRESVSQTSSASTQPVTD